MCETDFPVELFEDVEVLGIVPARGIDVFPEKCWALLKGKPLLDYTLDAALKSRSVSRVVVSTEQPEIAEHAIDVGAEAPFLRPTELCAPEINLTEVLRHCLNWLEHEERYNPDVVVLLECSHPVRPPGLVDSVLASLVQQDLDTVFTAHATRTVFWRIDDSGNLLLTSPLDSAPRSARTPWYGQLTGLVCATKSAVLRSGSLIGTNVGVVPVRGLLGTLDTQEEGGIELAEFLLGRSEYDTRL